MLLSQYQQYPVAALCAFYPESFSLSLKALTGLGIIRSRGRSGRQSKKEAFWGLTWEMRAVIALSTRWHLDTSSETWFPGKLEKPDIELLRAESSLWTDSVDHCGESHRHLLEQKITTWEEVSRPMLQ